jgi:hypothetical protein
MSQNALFAHLAWQSPPPRQSSRQVLIELHWARQLVTPEQSMPQTEYVPQVASQLPESAQRMSQLMPGPHSGWQLAARSQKASVQLHSAAQARLQFVAPAVQATARHWPCTQISESVQAEPSSQRWPSLASISTHPSETGSHTNSLQAPAPVCGQTVSVPPWHWPPAQVSPVVQ